jgi:hypothetical protein
MLKDVLSLCKEAVFTKSLKIKIALLEKADKLLLEEIASLRKKLGEQ